MSCNNPQQITQTIICAKLCTIPPNLEPIAGFTFEDFVLLDSSQYFDKGNQSLRQVRWTVYIEDYLVYDFGFNGYSEIIPELANGSTYSAFGLGVNNSDILSFLENMPSTIVPVGTKLKILIEVRDNIGTASTNISNKYCFLK